MSAVDGAPLLVPRAIALAHRCAAGSEIEPLRAEVLTLGRDSLSAFRAQLESGAPGVDSPLGEAQVERLATACELLETCAHDATEWQRRDLCERVLLYVLRLEESLANGEHLEQRATKLVDVRRRARSVWASLDALVLDASLSRLRHAVTAMSALLGGPHLQSVGPLPRHQLRHMRDALAASAREPRMPAPVSSLLSQTSHALRIIRSDELLIERDRPIMVRMYAGCRWLASREAPIPAASLALLWTLEGRSEPIDALVASGDQRASAWAQALRTESRTYGRNSLLPG